MLYAKAEFNMGPVSLYLKDLHKCVRGGDGIKSSGGGNKQ